MSQYVLIAAGQRCPLMPTMPHTAHALCFLNVLLYPFPIPGPIQDFTQPEDLPPEAPPGQNYLFLS